MLARKFWHKSLTDERISEAAADAMGSLDNPGFCLQCGTDVSGIESDAENLTCEACTSEQVFGADALLLAIF